MKILVTGSIFYPLTEKDFKGGIECIAVNTWNLLNKLGHDAYLTGTSDSVINSDKFIASMTPSKNHEAKVNPGKMYKLKWKEEFLETLRDHDFDLIISSLTSVRLTKQLLESVNRKTKVVHYIHRHAVHRNDPAMYEAYNKLKAVHPNFTGWGVSEFIRKNINAIAPDYVSDVLHPTFANPGLKSESKTRSAMFVGRFSKEKGLEIPLNAYMNQGIEFTMIGDPPTNPPYELEWYKQNIEPIIHTAKTYSNIPQEEVWKHMAKCSCVVIPRYDESFSLVAFEAQKMGVPVINLIKKVNCGVQEYMVEGVTGFSIDISRKRSGIIQKMLLQKTEEAFNLDKSKIYDIFKENYSEELYVDKLVKLGYHENRL